MNIGSLIRGLLGEQKPGDAKTLELKPGQVVRGVVMNVSEDGQEAVVQIQGVQVKAKLEAPLRAGETALLQVQPPGEGGTAVLKPLSQTPGQPLSPSSMAEVLDFAGLPDTKENREMIRGMQNAGVPLTKDNIAMFREALAVKPPQIPAAEWAESAAIAFHRGLPISPESVKGLHQAVFGPQLHQLLQSLEQQLTSALSNSSGGAAAAGKNAASAAPATAAGAAGNAAAQQQAAAANNAAGVAAQAGSGQQALLTKLQGLLQQLRGELAQPWASGGTAAPAAGQPAAVPTGPAAALGEGAAGPSPKPPTPGAEPWVGRLLKLLGAEHEQQALRGAGTGPAGEAARAGNAAPAAPAGQPAATAATPGSGTAAGAAHGAAAPGANSAVPASAAAPTAAGAAAPAPAAAQPSAAAAAQASLPATSASGNGGAAANMPGAFATPGNAANANQQAPGVPNAQTGAVNQPGLTQPVTPTVQQQITQGVQQAAMAAGPSGDSSLALQDTLKGALLQVLSSQDAPPALKEASQQVVQHLTGQQLLLNTDRTAPFAQVTLFIPLHGADGEQTASVHIQSRRGRKGELDATNCRLLFDLDMKFLGPTLIDVQVVDRIVSLNFRNDQPFAAELFEGTKQELAQAVSSIGYQLLSVKTEPLPLDLPPAAEDSVQGTAAEYTPQVYKGVDMRI
ncbi:hypothetical protein SAMN04488688_101294 [Paenibacillus sp. cl141a]|uniref:hypothetical protein n=1 Tax=Paenibacillus sp. cl141a TaxID=1761877 RepID=UPI0008D7673F|nr:hypothetical protein [Paenibacillus sp. cl141a]SEK25739.1 hypothetical protein SAMN04488688_101294 [Paenibacillus sp. cl141a]